MNPTTSNGQKMPSPGRMVHYVLKNGEHRPALVLRTWSATCVQLAVFLDGANDNGQVPYETYYFQNGNLTVWKTSVMQDEETKAQATWHWPEYVP